MSDGDMLLAAILDNPEEDAPRLVYADWLQENGEAERAEFIRVQIELSHPTLGPDGAGDSSKRYELVMREKKLFANRALKWFPNVTDGEFKWNLPGEQWGRNGCWFTRGFASEIRLPLAAWEQHAAEIWARHPVVSVRITGKRPISEYMDIVGEHWRWVCNDASEFGLPERVFCELKDHITLPPWTGMCKDYRTEADAMKALSDAACLVGRRRARDRQRQTQEATT